MILALFLETTQKRPRKGEVMKQKQSTFWMKTNQMFDSVAVITSEKIFFDEIVVKILDTFVGLNFTRELQDILSAVFQMKNEGICQFSWS